MEHIVQFGITIDDEYIKKSIEEGAENAISKEMAEQVRKVLIMRWCGNDEPTIYFDKKLTEVINEYKDEIINLAADRLAERLRRTKAVKDIVKDIKEEVSEE